MFKELGKHKIIFVIFLALILRIGSVIRLGNQPPTTHDGLVFDDIATNMLEKGKFQIGALSPERRIVFYDVKEGLSWREPLYPFFLASIYKVFGHNFLAVRLIETFIGVLTVLSVYIIGIRFLNRGIAYIASLLIATYPPFIEFTGLFLRENLLVFLSSLLVFWLMEVSSKESLFCKNYAYIGLLLGLIALLKAMILIFLPFFLALLLFKKRAGVGSSIKTAAVTLSITILVIVPWTIRNYMVHHKLVLISTSGGINFLIGNNPNASGTNEAPWPAYSSEQQEIINTLKEADQDRQYFKWGLMYIRQDPLKYLRLAFKKFLIFWFDSYGGFNTAYGFTTRVFDAYLLIFGFFGILYSLTAWREYLASNLFILAITLAHMIFFAVVRNRFLVIPLFSLYAALGLTALIRIFRNLNSKVFIEGRKEVIIKFLVTLSLALGYLSYHILRVINKISF